MDVLGQALELTAQILYLSKWILIYVKSDWRSASYIKRWYISCWVLLHIPTDFRANFLMMFGTSIFSSCPPTCTSFLAYPSDCYVSWLRDTKDWSISFIFLEYVLTFMHTLPNSEWLSLHPGHFANHNRPFIFVIALWNSDLYLSHFFYTGSQPWLHHFLFQWIQ